eukprot:gene7990-7386_t
MCRTSMFPRAAALALCTVSVAEGKAAFRAVHAVPTAPFVDVYVSGVGIAIKDLGYASASSWVFAPAGKYDVAITLSSNNAT